jgi:glycosyltransferase involved in cell wall biosynthesis
MTRPLRVLIDGRMTVGRFSGVARVVACLVDELGSRGDTRVAVLCGRDVPGAWRAAPDIEVVATEFGREDRSPVRRRRWEETILREVLRAARVDLFHATWNSGIPSRCPVPAVLTVHDFIGWRAAAREVGGWRARMALRGAMRSSIHRAGRITTVSEHVRSELLAQFALDSSKVVAVPNGVRVPEERSGSRSETAGPDYALYVGGYEKRKNLAGLLQAFEEYWERFDDSLLLRMTGSAASLPEEVFRVYETMRWRQRVAFVGRPSDDELAALYRGASLLAFLSHDEGFGLPALEAMAFGCPVLASNRGALPEVVGDAGWIVDPADRSGVVEAIFRLRADAALRKQRIRRGLARASVFSWGAAAERMRQVYEDAVGEAGGNRGLPGAESSSLVLAEELLAR